MKHHASFITICLFILVIIGLQAKDRRSKDTALMKLTA